MPPYDYGAYLANMPRSILVLPPRNESLEVMASYVYLSTVTRPLAERGYYVFPVAVIDAFMKENGLPHPDDMARVSISKIEEIIDPDAILYMTVKDWGTKYRLIDSVTTVHLVGQLIHTDTGAVLWEGEHIVQKSSSEGQSDPLGMLVAGVINQILSTFVDPTRPVARLNNEHLFLNAHDGLLVGERSPAYGQDQRQRQRRAVMNQTTAEQSGP